jgi:ubiquinone/menaquinone biosynthesis C-methylase UbiE/uncharacterized protein YbaR (Trm112 family)
MTRGDVATLVCPACGGRLRFDGTLAGDQIAAGHLRCNGCARAWPVDDGLPNFVEEAAIQGLERIFRFMHDTFAAFYDPTVCILLPLMQFSSEATSRDAYMRRLDLGSLEGGTDGRPCRILEVGIGTGANLPLVERDLPRDLEVELWGLDLSRGMIEHCRRRVTGGGGRSVRFLLGDAHTLPFPDASFDRVFHVGAIASYRDPRRGLAEMARVARPGTPIVVVDEQLDPHRRHCLYHRLMFRALTLYDRAPSSPSRHLPDGAVGVIDEQASRFYYCLTFSMPAS